MKRVSIIIIICLASLFFWTSCEKVDTDPVGVLNPQGKEAFAAIELTKAEEAMTDDINMFGWMMLQRLVADEPDKDIVISPLSISLALAMTAGGAEGETAQQMCETLGFEGYSSDEMGKYYAKMIPALKKADRNCALEVANAIWINRLLSVKDDFIRKSKANFASEVHDQIDFSLVSTRHTINSWVEDQTHGKIKDLLQTLDASTMMVLVNALYFNGRWGFKWDGSKRGSFLSSSGKKTNVDMMHLKGTGFNYGYKEFGSSSFQVIDLPYGNGAFRLSVILPESDASNFRKDLAALPGAGFASILRTSPYSGQQTIRIPAFKVDYSKEDLERDLQYLGMKRPFSGEADFSGISDTPLYISQVAHKAYIDVNLSGTEAAAATAVVMVTSGVNAEPPRPISFVADHPFIFAIREASTGAVIFLGVKS